MRPGPTLAAAALLALAGCGIAGGPAHPPVTPAEIPGDPREEPTTREWPTLAPGVSRGGVDPAALALAHRDALRARNASVRVTRTVTATDGSTLARTDDVVRLALSARRFLSVRVRRGPPSSPLVSGRTETAYWRAGSFGVVRRVSGDGDAVYALARGERFRASLDDPTRAGLIASALRAFEHVGVTATPKGRVTVAGAGLSRPDVLARNPRLREPRAGWLRLTVAETGVVRSYVLRYRADVAGGDRTVTVVERLRVRSLTRVEPPSWLPAARNATGTAATTGGSERGDGVTRTGVQASWRISSATRWANSDVASRSPPSIWRSMS